MQPSLHVNCICYLWLLQVPHVKNSLRRGLWGLGYHQMKLRRTYGIGLVNQGLLDEEGHPMYVLRHHQHEEHCRA